MKIAIVYESKREEYRVKKIKRALKRTGLSAVELLLRVNAAASVIGVLVFGCSMDSEDLGFVLKGFMICLLSACISAALITVIKDM